MTEHFLWNKIEKKDTFSLSNSTLYSLFYSASDVIHLFAQLHRIFFHVVLCVCVCVCKQIMDFVNGRGE